MDTDTIEVQEEVDMVEADMVDLQADGEMDEAVLQRSRRHRHPTTTTVFEEGGEGGEEVKEVKEESEMTQNERTMQSEKEIDKIIDKIPKIPGGRLSKVPEKIWREAGITNQWALDLSHRRLRLPFVQSPTPIMLKPNFTYERTMSELELQQVDVAVKDFLDKEAIEEVLDESEKMFFSNIFPIHQRDKIHTILDARNLNSFIEYQHFKMEGL